MVHTMKHITIKSSLLTFDNILEKAQLRAGHFVADLGCGNNLSFLYNISQKIGEKGLIYAIDLIPSIIDQLKRELAYHDLNGVVPIQGNLDEQNGIELKDHSVDISFLLNTLHQSSDTLTMLSEAHRITKSNGKILIIDWDESDNHGLGPHISRRLKKNAVIESAHLLQLELLEDFKPGPYHFGLIFIKK